MQRETTQGVIERLLGLRSVLSTRDVVDQARVSRQAAQKMLRVMVQSGVLTIEGRARAARYRRAAQPRHRIDDSSNPRPVGDSSSFAEGTSRPAALWIARSLMDDAGPVGRIDDAPPLDTSGEAGQVNRADDAPALDTRGQVVPANRVEDAPAREAREAPGDPAVKTSVVDDSSSGASTAKIAEAPPAGGARDHGVSRVDGTAGVDDLERGADPPRSIARRFLEVVGAGSLYRLSARALLWDIEPGGAVLDFTGVTEVGDEFLEEIFEVWARTRPDVRLEVVNLASPVRAKVARAARAQQLHAQRALAASSRRPRPIDSSRPVRSIPSLFSGRTGPRS